MNKIVHRSIDRGFSNLGWLESYHSFSFADYVDLDKMHFGALRVLNDDRVDAGKGFSMHSHQNMEIISIPLSGGLEHQDNMGNRSIIQQGDVQVMSAVKVFFIVNTIKTKTVRSNFCKFGSSLTKRMLYRDTTKFQ